MIRTRLASSSLHIKATRQAAPKVYLPAVLRARALATLAEDVKSDSTFRIPLIDFGRFRAAKSQAEKQAAANEVVNGFKEVGFIYLNVSPSRACRLEPHSFNDANAACPRTMASPTRW
jgi:hypothetical protein